MTAQGLLGLAYGLHSLREALALSSSSSSPSAALQAWVAAHGASAPGAPQYAVRAWSEEGQLLALPDRGFYTPDGSQADVAAIAEECSALEAELVPALLRLRFNALIVLHSDLEDYVTYDALPHFLPGAPAIYAANRAT